MDPHTIELPRIVLVGNNLLEKLPDVCKEIGIEKGILVLADRTTRYIIGDKAKEMLQAAGLSTNFDIVHDSTDTEVDRIGARNKPGLVIAAGGGKVIDVAKMVAYRNDRPFISVPTAPSHDGIASERASISGWDGSKYSLRAKPPIAIIADIGMLKSAPYRLIASGAADVISNNTAVHDWKLAAQAKSEYYSEYAASLSLLSSEIVINSAAMIKDLEDRGIRNLVEALISSSISMSLVGSSRPASGAEHAFSHALEILGSKALHGEQCGIGSILMAHHQGQDWEGIKDALAAVGAPTTTKQLGISDDKAIEALLEAKNIRDRYSILDEKPLDRKAAGQLCRETGVFG